MHRTSATVVISALLAACGGGGADDTADSSNPPLSGPPIAATPTPAAPAPIPSPVSPLPAPPALPGVSPAPAPVVTGAILRKALTTRYDDARNGRDGLAWGTSGDGSNAFVYQIISGNPKLVLDYNTASGGSTLTSVSMRVSMPYGTSNSVELGQVLHTPDVTLVRPTRLAIDADSYVLNQTLAEWSPPGAGDPWFVQLQLQSDSRSDTTFRVCWHVHLPQIIRLWCGLFDRLTGDHRGIVLIDDSEGLGAKIWQTP